MFLVFLVDLMHSQYTLIYGVYNYVYIEYNLSVIKNFNKNHVIVLTI